MFSWCYIRTEGLLIEPIHARMLQSRNVFVDTQVFVQYGLNLDHPNLVRLCKLSGSGRLQLLTTDAVVGEVRRKVTEHLAEGLAGLSKFRKRAGFLRLEASPEHAALFLEPLEDQLRTAGFTLWERYPYK